VQRWNAYFSAARETQELRAETLQMGFSLRQLLLDAELFDGRRLAALRAVEPIAFPTAFSFASAEWKIPGENALAAYSWAWLENQAMAAMKAVPLGQVAAQRLLHDLGAEIPRLVENALTMPDDALANFAPGFAIASCRHETQYSRLFRS
jgi:urease accessory protein